jgi:hypothetical protein
MSEDDTFFLGDYFMEKGTEYVDRFIIIDKTKLNDETEYVLAEEWEDDQHSYWHKYKSTEDEIQERIDNNKCYHVGIIEDNELEEVRSNFHTDPDRNV